MIPKGTAPVHAAAHAPASGPSVRNSYVDALRALAIGAVVLGHWLLTDVRYQKGTFEGVDTIGYVSWAPWVTIILQVVPIFFLVGGYANALSWSRADKSWDVWLRLRVRRLLGPTLTYMAVAVAAVTIAQLANVKAANIDQAGWALAFHLWFLAAYAAMLVLTPLLFAAHRRWGFAVPLAMGALAVLISAGVVQWHWPVVGWANYLFVWGTFHQLGFAWYDGVFARRRVLAPALTAAALIALVGLIWLGPYPVSMVGMPGARIQNPSPPSAALLAFGLTQCGLALAAEKAANRWLARRPSAQSLAQRGAALSMPIYLWHMVPAVAVIVLVYPTHLFRQPPIGSAGWWVKHTVWVVVLSIVLALLLAVLAFVRRGWLRLRPKPQEGVPTSPALVLGGVVLAAVALARLAINGFAPNGRTDLVTLAIFAIGVVMALARRPQPGAAIRPLPPRRQARASAKLS